MKNSATNTGTVLDEIVANKRVELSARRLAMPLEALATQVTGAKVDFAFALKGEGVQLIAEIKPRSPSAGQLAEKLDVEAIVHAYEQFASGISVLTDQRYFGGSLELLSQVAAITQRPLLCKDFIIDAYQVYEARRAGAAAVLLIVKILPDETLHELHALITELAMTPVVEVQTAEEVNRALKLNPRLMLINNRDLSTFEIDLTTTARLVPLIPKSVPVVSASGIETRADVETLLPYTNKFLVGSSLMRAKDLLDQVRRLCGN